MRIGKKVVDMPLLADGVVRYIGEKVAAVAAETEEAAERAVDLIEVDYDELPGVADSLEAIRESAPVLHPDVAEYKGLLHKIDAPSNVFVHLKWNKGDVDEGFGSPTWLSKIPSRCLRCIRPISNPIRALCEFSPTGVPRSGLQPRVRSPCASKWAARCKLRRRTSSFIRAMSGAISAARETPTKLRFAMCFRNTPAGR